MAKLTKYEYYGVRGEYAWRMSVYLQSYSQALKMPQLFRESQRVWQQGPRGGIKLVRNNWEIENCGYITNDAEALKEFAWVKLRAVDVTYNK